MIFDALADEASDHTYFPLPDWDYPFAPNAHDGTFV